MSVVLVVGHTDDYNDQHIGTTTDSSRMTARQKLVIAKHNPQQQMSVKDMHGVRDLRS